MFKLRQFLLGLSHQSEGLDVFNFARLGVLDV